jgi:hypothetical protein
MFCVSGSERLHFLSDRSQHQIKTSQTIVPYSTESRLQTFKPTHKQYISVLYSDGIFSFKREGLIELEETLCAIAPVPTAGMRWKDTRHLENGGSC